MKKLKIVLLVTLILSLFLQCSTVFGAADYKDVKQGMFTKFAAYSHVPQVNLTYYIKKSDFPDKDKELIRAANMWNNVISGLTLSKVESESNADITLYLSNSYYYNDPTNTCSGECNLYDKYGLCVNNDPKSPALNKANYIKAECNVFMKSPNVKNEYVEVMAHEIGHALGLDDLNEYDLTYKSMHPKPIMLPGQQSGRATMAQPTDTDNLKKRWLNLSYVENKYFRADFNNDGACNMLDIMSLAKYFNTRVMSDTDEKNTYDVNNDNVINMQDVVLVARLFNKTINDID